MQRTWKFTGWLLGLALLLAGIPSFADEGRYPIWTRGAIVNSGKYILTRDLLPGPGPAIDIAPGVDHVDIDLNGFTVFGDPAGGDVIVAAGFRRSVTIRNGEIRNQGPPGMGILVSEAEKVVIEDVKITDAQDIGIFLRDVRSFALRRNVILDANADGIAIDNSGSPNLTHGTIEDNLVRDCGGGIAVFFGSSVAVLNNRIEQTFSANGILLESVNAALVATNTVESAADAGILLSSVAGGKVYNNVVTKCGASGVIGLGVNDVLFLDNTSTANGGSGMEIDGRQNQFDRNILNSNGLSGLHLIAGSSANTYGRNMMRSNAAGGGACVNPATGCAGPDFCDDNALPSGNSSFLDNFAPGGC